MAVFVELEPLGTCVCLQPGVVQHCPFQSRAGWHAFDFVRKPFFEGGAVSRGRRADNGGLRRCRRVGGRRRCRGHEERSACVEHAVLGVTASNLIDFDPELAEVRFLFLLETCP